MAALPRTHNNNNQTDAQHAARARHTSINQYGELCMTVVDPVSRKLLVPIQYVYRTRAQQRNTLPSLCLLFLNRRCRQGAECYQVHANREVVQLLRNEIDSLPCCCVAHGDVDRAAEGEQPHEPTVVFLPGCKPTSFSGGYIPIANLSYTVALRRLLHGPTTSAEAVPGVNVLDASGYTICRLHALDRCRYAEDCKFLHVCKQITESNPDLITTANNTNEEADAQTAADAQDAPTSPQTAPGANEETANNSNNNATTTTTTTNNNSNSSFASRPHASVFTTVTRRQQNLQHDHLLRRSMPPACAASSFPTPAAPAFGAPNMFSSPATGPISPTTGPVNMGDPAAPRSNLIGTWLVPSHPAAQPNRQYAQPQFNGSFGTPMHGYGSCSSFQDNAAMMASSVPAFVPTFDGSQSLSTMGYSGTSFQPMSPVKIAAVASGAPVQGTSRRPLLVPLCDGAPSSTNTAPASAKPQSSKPVTAHGSLGQELGAHHGGGSCGSLHSSGEADAAAHSHGNEERGSPVGDGTRRRDARDPSRWSYNPYGNSLISP